MSVFSNWGRALGRACRAKPRPCATLGQRWPCYPQSTRFGPAMLTNRTRWRIRCHSRMPVRNTISASRRLFPIVLLVPRLFWRRSARRRTSVALGVGSSVRLNEQNCKCRRNPVRTSREVSRRWTGHRVGKRAETERGRNEEIACLFQLVPPWAIGLSLQYRSV